MSRKIYDYNKCFDIAKQCSSSSEMRDLNGSAYNVARKNKWIADYVWFVREQHTPYTYEEVYEIAKQYNCSSDFQKGNGSAYGKARANDWIKDYTWFVVIQRAPYTREQCYEIAKKYKTRVAFAKGDGGAYNAALNHGWLDDYYWIHLQQKPNNYWTKERVLEESRQYKTRGEFHDNNGTAYSKARTNGWLDECTWLKDERIDFSVDKIDCVYAYEFLDYNLVYVGRTLMRRIKDRDMEHLFRETDAVSLFVREKKIPVPPIKILESNLTLSEGVEKEGYYLEWYRKNGWKVLNRMKTGSIGLLAKNKWTKDSCYKEALKYRSRSEFAESNGGAYDVARRKGWLETYSWFEEKQKPNNYWNNYDNCFNAASECKTVSEFIRKYDSAWKWAKQHGWLKDYIWFLPPMRVKKWEYESCYAIAKKYNYQSDFSKYDTSAYTAAKRHGWLDSFDWLVRQDKKPNGYWNYDHCYEEAKKYKSSTEFQRKNQTAWIAARKNKWLNEYTWFANPNIKWTYDECKRLASQAKGRFDFRKKSLGAHDASYRNHWLDEFFPKKK